MRSDTIFINKNENKAICIHEIAPVYAGHPVQAEDPNKKF